MTASRAGGGVVLALDASTYVGTVAVLRDGAVVATATAAMRGEREERLMPAVVEALRSARATPAELSSVVCGGGPGSFTSLRIAGSIAKGIAMASGAPLRAVPSLALIVAGAEPALPAGRYLAALDAMRGDSYAALVEVDAAGDARPAGELELVPTPALTARAAALAARLAGPGQPLDLAPHARGVARLAGWLAAAAPVDLGAWEPAYGRPAEAQVKWELAHGRALPRA